MCVLQLVSGGVIAGSASIPKVPVQIVLLFKEEERKESVSSKLQAYLLARKMGEITLKN